MGTTLTVVLNVGNVEKSAWFYNELGFKVKTRAEADVTFAEATLGDAQVTLFPKESPWLTEEGRGWLSGPLGNGVVAFFTTSKLEKLWENAERAGALVEMPLQTQPWGRRAFMVNDPDGYVLGFEEAAAKPRAKRTGAKPAGRGAKGKARGATKKRK